MKLIELFEEHSEDDLNYELFAKKIFDDCQPYLKAAELDYDNIATKGADANALFRGQKGLNPNQILQKCSGRKNRKPLHTTQEMSDFIDEVLFHKFGVHFRKDSVFASGQLRNATPYGAAYMMFPIGTYDFCWSPVVDDAYEWFFNGYQPLIKDYAWKYFPDVEDFPPMGSDEFYALLDSFISGRANYQTTDIKKARNSGHEIMIANCDYYMLSLKGDHYEEVIKELAKLSGDTK